jgi:hypothetical protein
MAALKNPAIDGLIPRKSGFQRLHICLQGKIDEKRSLPYKPANCPRWPGLAPERLILAGNGSVGPASLDYPQFLGELPGLIAKVICPVPENDP